MSPQHLHLILVACGVGNRKKALSYVCAGRVCLNGVRIIDRLTTADLEGGDIVTFDNRTVVPERLRYVLAHKPRDVLCAMDDINEWRGEDREHPKFERRTLVSSLVPSDITERLGHAGRLDLDSEGLVLLTNDRRLMGLVIRPGGACRKEYIVTVVGIPSEADLVVLRNGSSIKGIGQLLPCTIKIMERITARVYEKITDVRGFTRLRVELREGKNNQIRRMFSSIGHRVVRLVRTSIGHLRLDSVPWGGARELSVEEVKQLRVSCGCGDSVRSAS